MKKSCFLLFMFATTPSWAYDCPNPGVPCKVITLAPDEEQALIGQGMILDTAERGKYIDLAPATKYFRDKIKEAPVGEVTKPKEVSKTLEQAKPNPQPPEK